MVNEELERWIHENIMQDCWHQMEFDKLANSDVCQKCGIHIAYMWGGSRSGVNSNKYTTSLDAIAKVEEKVAEKVGKVYLRTEMFQAMYDFLKANGKYTNANAISTELVFADALIRAKACKVAWGSK